MKHLPVTLTTENPLLWHFLCEEGFLTDLLKKSSGTSPQYICAIYANLTLPVTGCFWPSFYRYLDSCCLVPMSCLTLCDSTNCSPPGSSVPGISQARILEWVAISYFMGSSWPRDRSHVSCSGRRILYHWATWEAHHTQLPLLVPNILAGPLETLKWNSHAAKKH